MILLFEKIIKKFCLLIINRFFSTTRFFNMKRRLLIISGFDIGKGTKVVGPLHIGTCAKLTIGNNCWIGSNLSIYGNGSVLIGNNCDLAPDVGFVTGSHTIGFPDRRAGEGVSYKIEIGNGCWIGARVTILGDVVLSDSLVIGACSLVNKNIPSNVIAAGLPAKIIKNI